MSMVSVTLAAVPSTRSALLGKGYQVVVKWHPALYNNVKRGLVSFDGEGVVDASSYSDINDLMVVADILVTDYSSVIFDWYLLDKPVIYFTYDLDEYEAGRGLYFDFDDYVYGQVATDYEGLIDAIKREDLAAQKRQAFGDKFMSACDGRSTERTIEWILDK